MAEPEKKEAEAEAPKPKGKKKLIIIIVVVVVLLGGAAMFLLKGKAPDKSKGDEKEAEVKKHYQTLELESFVVNLTENNTFLKVKLLLEYDPEILKKASSHGEGGGGGYGGGGGGEGEGKGGGPPGLLGEREPMIRDAIIRVLSSKKKEDVLSSEGKEQLKEELLQAINDAIGFDEPIVVGIYFTEFIIQ